MKPYSVRYEDDVIKIIIPNDDKSSETLEQIRKDNELKRFENKNSTNQKPPDSEALENILSLRGILKDENTSSTQLLKEAILSRERKYGAS